jgi:hypothetical protein
MSSGSDEEISLQKNDATIIIIIGTAGHDKFISTNP